MAKGVHHSGEKIVAGHSGVLFEDVCFTLSFFKVAAE